MDVHSDKKMCMGYVHEHVHACMNIVQHVHKECKENKRYCAHFGKDLI